MSKKEESDNLKTMDKILPYVKCTKSLKFKNFTQSFDIRHSFCFVSKVSLSQNNLTKVIFLSKHETLYVK